VSIDSGKIIWDLKMMCLFLNSNPNIAGGIQFWTKAGQFVLIRILWAKNKNQLVTFQKLTQTFHPTERKQGDECINEQSNGQGERTMAEWAERVTGIARRARRQHDNGVAGSSEDVEWGAGKISWRMALAETETAEAIGI
jgi:hypothetical protein